MLPLPAVVVSYRGSNANINYPRKTFNFSVLVVTEDVGSFEAAAEKSALLIDKVTELLDYEECNGVLFQFQNDVPIEMNEYSIAAYNLSFQGLDY